jgi:hypothetical protein
MSGDAETDGEEISSVSSGAGNIIKAADSKLLTLLLGPSVQEVGKFFHERTKAYIDRLRAAKNATVEAHVSRVIGVVGEPKEVRAGQLIKIERWIQIAEDVPIEDAARAAIVEASLAEIVTTDGAADYQEVAQKLTSRTARLLLESPTDAGVAAQDYDQPAFDELKFLGLAGASRRKQLVKWMAAWLIGTLVGLLILFDLVLPYLPAHFPRLLPLFLATEFVVDAVLVSVLIATLGISFVSTTYRLTDLGKRLQQSAKRFYQQPNEKLISAVPRKLWIIWSGVAALFVCSLPFALQAYLPVQLRFNAQPPTVIISSPPASQSGATPTAPPALPTSAGATPQQITLTGDEIRTLIDVWRSVTGQMNEIIALDNAGQELIPIWPERVRSNAEGFALELLRQRDSVNQHRVSLVSLNNVYQRYPNVSSVLAEATRDGVFDRLYRALESFAHEVRGVAVPPPADFENKLRPYAGELKGALDAMAKWANGTRNFAMRQGDELSKIDIK